MKKCINCESEIIKDRVPIKTNDGFQVCSEWCKDDWNLDTVNQ